MTGSDEQNSNLSLFVEELGEQLSLLNGALLDLESDSTSSGSRDSLMRAAHTVKGAARMVGLTVLERLAHAIEDLVLAALAAAPDVAPLPPDAVALLFRAFDRLEQFHLGPSETLPERLRVEAEAMAALEGDLQALTLTLGPQNPSSRAGDLPGSTSGSPAAGAAPGGSAGAPPAERTVKLDALQLNRIAALAGESMVAARWLQPFADGLQQLRSRQREVTELITANDPQLDLIREKERQCQLRSEEHTS